MRGQHDHLSTCLLAHNYGATQHCATLNYQEMNDIPGMCVESADGSIAWSPMKFSKSGVRASSCSDSDD